MNNKLKECFTKPWGKLTFREILIQSFVTMGMLLVMGFFYSIIFSHLLDGGFNYLFISMIIISIIGFLFIFLTPFYKKWIKFTSKQDNKLHYQARSLSFLFFGVILCIMIVTIFLYYRVAISNLIGLIVAFMYPTVIIFLRREYYYNENGAVQVETDSEFLYNIALLTVAGIILGMLSIWPGFICLSSYFTSSEPSLLFSMIFILIVTILLYFSLCPDFWNRYLPFNVRDDRGMFLYLIMWALIFYAINVFCINVFDLTCITY